jgi:serine/threonine-protein kinase
MPGSKASLPKQADEVAGERFGKYVLVKRLAVGGMAEVSLARLEGTAGFNKLVVIKQVLPGFAEMQSFVDMFLDEGRLAARLSHPNIAQTFELGVESGRHYIAMEYVPGETLFGVLKRCRETDQRLSMGNMLRVMMQLLEALDYAHELTDDQGAPLKLVHRDVTPSNIMVTRQGGIKLLDFGIARAATQVHHTEVGSVKGKGGYMSPEQCRGSKIDNRTDIYSVGAVLYFMATGQRPFDHLPPGTDLLGQMAAAMEGAFHKPHELMPDIHGELERIILKAMALRQEDRYATAGAMLKDLERFSAQVQAFPSARDLGDFVKKLFPKENESALPAGPPPEPGSVSATPGPTGDEKLATNPGVPSVGSISAPVNTLPAASLNETLSPDGSQANTITTDDFEPMPAGSGPKTLEQTPMIVFTRALREAWEKKSLKPLPPWFIAGVAGVIVVLFIALLIRSAPVEVDPSVARPLKRSAVQPKVGDSPPRPAPPPPAPVEPPRTEKPAAVEEKAPVVAAEPARKPEVVAVAEPVRAPEPEKAPEPAPPPAAEPAPVAADAPSTPEAQEPAAAAAEPSAPATAPSTPRPVRPSRTADAPEPKAAPPPKKAVAHKTEKGTVELNAYPWAKVRLRGKELGITPLKFDLPPGEYSIEFENPVLAVKRTVKLTVREGQETTHFERLAQ